MKDPATTPIIALLYRTKAGAGQYTFTSADELQTWAARPPYRSETVIVHLVDAAGTLSAPRTMPALAAADYVRRATAEAHP